MRITFWLDLSPGLEARRHCSPSVSCPFGQVVYQWRCTCCQSDIGARWEGRGLGTGASPCVADPIVHPLVIGSVVAAAAGAGAVWAMHGAMKKTFMFTVRKLAGTA